VEKDTKRTRKDILNILPQDLTKEQVDTLRESVKLAVMNGYIFDGAERKKLLKCEFAERYKEIIRTMEGNQTSSEVNERMLERLDPTQEQWVQSDFEGMEHYPEEDYDQHEGDESPPEAFAPLTRKGTENAGALCHQGRSHSSFEEEDEAVIASFYPIIGIFKTKEDLDKACEKTSRPGENLKVESQSISTSERAVGAIQVRHPDFVRGRMNDFKMATIKGISQEWYLRDGPIKVSVSTGGNAASSNVLWS
jgi:hypothetical protein